ncbi:Lon protease family protein [Dongia sp.]|uniref:Lon protease family protein n=1 Tax=Dongia sp. TaxID=1977262 RepID=UPI0035AE6ABC
MFGPTGAGRHTLVQALLQRVAPQRPRPDDWCYINNFAEPHQPTILRLPAGRAVELRSAMDRTIKDLRVALPSAFEREDYRTRRDALTQQAKSAHESAFDELRLRAEAQEVAVLRTPFGLTLAPLKDKEPIRPADFDALTPAEQERIRQKIETLQVDLEKLVRQIPTWEREMRESIRQLNQEVVVAVTSLPFGELKGQFKDIPAVIAYLSAVEQDIQQNADEFLSAIQNDGHGEFSLEGAGRNPFSFRRYQVNAIVDNSSVVGAPVIFENNPTHQNLVGRVEHISRMGTLLTDFSLLAPGALHRANGGYLVLDAEKLLLNGFSWESLKRALRAGEVRIESIEQLLSLASTVSLRPEPMPLDLKIILIGSPRIYYLLSLLDPEFSTLFKVSAEFDDQVDRNPAATREYADFVACIVAREKLRSFEPGAVARVIEHASRLSGDAEKLSADMSSLADLATESDYCARIAGEEVVSRKSVASAIEARRRRADRLYRRFQEMVATKTVRIETSGLQIGQVNGLAVISLGGVEFGHPSRITARIQLGRGQVVDIERETELGGPIHSKGVLILSAFLGARFGMKRPLALNASIVFEQSYSGIEGDSASSAELYALLSAIADVPIDQSWAVTGSVDQRGQIQAIGGVNDKIEGFFDICVLGGLTGAQGVIIPAANVRNLMLRSDVVDAVRDGKFHIHAIEHIDQGIELLTGLPAGAAGITGEYPSGSVNERVMRRLAALAESHRQWIGAGGQVGRTGQA